jgi:hypothetical protein
MVTKLQVRWRNGLQRHWYHIVRNDETKQDNINTNHKESYGSSVSVAPDYGLDDLGSIRSRGKEFFL